MAATVRGAVEGGEYASTSEVVREALRDWTLKRAVQVQELAAPKPTLGAAWPTWKPGACAISTAGGSWSGGAQPWSRRLQITVGNACRTREQTPSACGVGATGCGRPD